MNNLTLDTFYKIWKSIDLFNSDLPNFILYYNSTKQGGNLRYLDKTTGNDVIIAEGNFNLKSSDKDKYELMIDDKQFNMRMFMVYDDCSEIDILVQNFGYIRFKGIIK